MTPPRLNDRLPDRFNGEDWLALQIAAHYRARGRVLQLSQGRRDLVVSKLDKLIRDGTDPWELAVALEVLPHEVDMGTTNDDDFRKRLTAGWLLNPTRKMGRKASYWRATYLARFVSEDRASDYQRLLIELLAYDTGMPEQRSLLAERVEAVDRFEQKVREGGRKEVWAVNIMQDFSEVSEHWRGVSDDD